MKISSSFNNVNNKEKYQSFKGIPSNPKYYPEALGHIGKVAGEYISMPEQKLFLALTALMFTPLIDLKFANDEQKQDAAIKSASKAIAGGFTGVAIRALFASITDHFIGFEKFNKLNRLFFPDNASVIKRNRPQMADLYMKQYTKTLGTLFAIAFMIFFSNSKVDVPLTSDLQDFISGIAKDNKSFLQSLNDVTNSRCNKIKNWFKHKKDACINIKNKLVRIVKIIREKPGTEVSRKEKSNELKLS